MIYIYIQLEKETPIGKPAHSDVCKVGWSQSPALSKQSPFTDIKINVV